MEEPSMLIQRPSTAQSQGTSHILVSTFRELFTKDSLDDNTIRNLSTSNREDHGYHAEYVDRLHKVQQAWEEMVADVDRVKEHLWESSRHARQLEETELEATIAKYPQYEQLGLPPVPSKLALCLDSSYLKTFNLVIPQTFLAYQDVQSHGTKAVTDEAPQYAKMTESQFNFHLKAPVEDNYAPEQGPPQPPHILDKSNLSAKSKLAIKKTHQCQKIEESERKNIWRDSMKPSQREIEKKDLSNLQNRADYLKNPRFQSEASSTLLKVSKDKTRLVASEYFQPSHSPIIFTDFEAGEAYQFQLNLKNITSSCRKVRVLPTTTNFFTVSIGEMPTENGLIAPGMNCTYIVTFTPDTLADYDDVLKVITQAEEPLLIPIQARRNSPRLTLSEDINCGYCLVGGVKELNIVCKNNGGRGTFIFTDNSEQLYETNWDQLVSKITEDVVLVDPFVFEPAAFSLDMGESITIKVTFKPLAVKSYGISLKMFCDNCTLKYIQITGSGELAAVHLSSVDGDHCLATLLPGQCPVTEDYEVHDISTDHFIRFPTQHPEIRSIKHIQISNTSSVSISFKWMVCLLQTDDAPSEDLSRSLLVPFTDSAFSVTDVLGILPGKSETSFQLHFRPKKLGDFSSVAWLQLLSIPTRFSGEYQLREVTALKLEMKGHVQPHTITVDPSVHFISSSYIGVGKHIDVNIRNESLSDVDMTWKMLNNDHIRTDFFPEKLTLGAGENCLCTVSVTGKQTGHCYVFCELDIPFSNIQQGLHIKANFMAPKVKFKETFLDFGLIQFHQHASCIITIENNSPIAAAWRIQEYNFKCPEQISPFKFEPDKGILQPNSKQDIKVFLHVYFPTTLETFFECAVYNSESCYLSVSADVQRPQACLSINSIEFLDSFLNIPCTQSVTLINKTLLTTRFKWKEVCGSDSDFVSVEFSPSSGTIHPHEKLIINLHFTGKKQDFLSKLLCVCEVEEMLEPLVLSISASVKGLDYEIHMPSMQEIDSDVEEISELDCLEFGYNNLLGENPHTLLVLENRSAIASRFHLSCENFPPAERPKGHPTTVNHTNRKQTQERPFLTKTANISDYSSKTDKQAQYDSQTAILRHGKGVAFVCSPSSGTLDPFGRQVIRVISYSDMWGEYIDNLICQVGDLPEKSIPVHIDVIGSPLNFQMTKDQPPVVRFGSHMSGGDTISRNMRINNTSHCDIRLDWQSYTLDLEDEQLLDLNVCIGPLFPGLDMVTEQEVSEGDDGPLIKVFLLEHQGIKSDQPFSVSPKQMMVPAKGNSTVQAHFKPLSSINEQIDFLGYALGYMILKKQYKKHVGEYSRCDGLDMLPFALNMTGSVKPAQLYLETCDDDGFSFEIAASELLNKDTGKISKSTIEIKHRYVLINNGPTTISFTCVVNEPFKIVSFNPGCKNNSKSGGLCNLKAGKNAELKISLSLSREKVLSLPVEEGSVASFKENLVMKFSNKTEQKYELSGVVFYPHLVLSSDVVNFGECFVGERQQLYVTLKNSSLSASSWKAKMDPNCPSASQSVFSLSVMSGQLEACTSNISRNTTELFVYFLPKHNLEYECTVQIFGLLCEPVLRLRMCGSGSYDETSKEKNQVSI